MLADRATSPECAVLAGQPAVVVAHPMGPEPAPLGLDRPLALLGGNRLAPTGMTSALGIDHAPGVGRVVAEACRRQSLAGRNWFQQPLLALHGRPGVGKGLAAHWIARNAGVPLYRMSIPAGDADGRHGLPTAACAIPPLPVMAMAASRCANPVIVVEVEAGALLDQRAEALLASMMDPRRNARWISEDLETIFDLSHISWILEVQVRSSTSPNPVADHAARRPIMPALPRSLSDLVEDSGTIVELTAPGERENLRCLDVAIAVCADEQAWRPAAVAEVLATLLDLRSPAGGQLACATLVQHARRALDSFRDEMTP